MSAATSIDAVRHCPACGRLASELAFEEHGRIVVDPSQYQGCDGCRQLADYEYERLQDIARGGAGDVCPVCHTAWSKRRRSSLSTLFGSCDYCLERKLKGMERGNEHAKRAARQWRKGHEDMASETRALAVRDEKGAAMQLRARFSQDLTTDDRIAEFLNVCKVYDLDPFIGEIVPFQGRPYVTEAGRMRKIQDNAPGELTLIETRIGTKEEGEQYELEAGDILAFATLERTYKNGRTLRMTGHGIVKNRERRPSEDETKAIARGARVRPIVQDPWMMAEKRARVPLLLKMFPDCLAGIKELPDYDEREVEFGGQAYKVDNDGAVVESSAAAIEAPTEQEAPPVDEPQETTPMGVQRFYDELKERGIMKPTELAEASGKTQEQWEKLGPGAYEAALKEIDTRRDDRPFAERIKS